MIEIAEVGAAAPEAWDSYLLQHDAGLVYGSSRFRSLLCELLGCRDRSLAATEAGELRGVLPLLERDGVLNSLPYYGSNGGVLADTPESARALVAAYADLTRSRSTRAATLIENPFAVPLYATLGDTHRDSRIAQWTDLPATGVEASAARNVRKARAAGIVVERDAGELPHLHELHEENIRALGGRPKERRFFDLVPRHLGGAFELWVARRDGRTIAALLTLLFNRTVEYYTPAIEHDARPLQPLAPILDAALADAADRGFTRWNWGGTWTSQSGVHRFKRKWGAREAPYAYHVQVNDEELLEASPEELLGRFPGFYVVPFAALREPVR